MATTTQNYNGPNTRGEELKSKLGDQLGSAAGVVGDTVRDATHKVEHKVETLAGDIAQRGRDVGDQVQEVAGNARHAVDTSLRQQPLATLAVAAAFGFVLGAIWKS